jgi:hypothetical protein
MSSAWRAPISHTRRPPLKRNPLQDVRRRLVRLSKPELIEQLLELQNAYAVVREAWLQASAGKLTKKMRRK